MSVLGKSWRVKNKNTESTLLKKLLENRGLTTDEQMQQFFYPDAVRDFHDPFLMKDMKRAVERIGRAINQSERIMIFGDYDVDGITGTAILMRALTQLGAAVSYRLPHRIEDGYGLREKFIQEFKKLDVKIVITVDNGISCAREVDLANELGIDVIISDHHTVPEKMPAAYALLHPKLPGDTYPFNELTGAGVALKLAQALFQTFLIQTPEGPTAEEEVRHLFDLACMGTIGDLGPLFGENRYIVKEGLKMLEHTRWPGLSRLKETAGVKGKITPHTIGFLLGPRINAAGRVSHPSHALRLLLHDKDHAHLLAEKLEKLNRERQNMMVNIMGVAQALAAKQANDSCIVISHPDFHGGIIGLIAARIAEKMNKPAIVMEDRGEVLVGSCRSISICNIVNALTENKNLLTAFGGHAMAAGFEVSKKNLAAFTKGVKKTCARDVGGGQKKSVLSIECEINEGEVSEKTLELLALFEPFGVANETPCFLLRDLWVESYKLLGSEKQHLKIQSELNGRKIDCMAFRMGEHVKLIPRSGKIDAVCHIEENVYRGKRSLQLVILDFSVV